MPEMLGLGKQVDAAVVEVQMKRKGMQKKLNCVKLVLAGLTLGTSAGGKGVVIFTPERVSA